MIAVFSHFLQSARGYQAYTTPKLLYWVHARTMFQLNYRGGERLNHPLLYCSSLRVCALVLKSLGLSYQRIDRTKYERLNAKNIFVFLFEGTQLSFIRKF